MERKGISPIIASILLLAVALAVVGIFSGWAPNLVQTVTEDTKNNTLETIDCNRAGIKLRSAFYNGNNPGGENYTVITVRNTGPVNLTDVIIATYDSDDKIIEQIGNLEYLVENPVNETNISGVSSEPSYIEAYSSKCSEVTDTIENINT
ncbi:MAG: archaellin/type IV pilin N-terminal domain-containing protein [Candidatus Nanohaloarchaea archaeon]